MSSYGINSVVDVCNLALSKLGQLPINSIENSKTKPERILSHFVDIARKELLRSGDFNFAIKRVLLPKLTKKTVFGNWASYKIPNDYIRILTVGEYDTKNFSLEEDSILTDEGDSSGYLKVRYVYDFKVVTKMDPFFIQAWASLLGSHIAYPLTNSTTSVERLKQEVVGYISLAKHGDAKESSIKVINNFKSYIRGGRPRGYK